MSIRRPTRLFLLVALLAPLAACGARNSGGGDSESHFLDGPNKGKPKPIAVRPPEPEWDASALTDTPDAATLREVVDAEPRLESTPSPEPRDAGAPLDPPPADAAAPRVETAAVVERDAALPVVSVADAGADAAAYKVLSAPELALTLSDDELWELAVGPEAPGIGACWVEDSTNKDGVCDYYVKCAIRGADLDFGWPKSAGNTSTGCVYGPNTGKRQSSCFYPEREAEFCTQDTRVNVLNQLRDAMSKDLCGDVSTVSVEAPSPG